MIDHESNSNFPALSALVVSLSLQVSRLRGTVVVRNLKSVLR